MLKSERGLWRDGDKDEEAVVEEKKVEIVTVNG